MDIDRLYEEDGPLARAMGEGYRERTEQVRFAWQGYDMFKSGGVLLADCKTGLGKGGGYGGPALIDLAETGKKTIISTGTNTLIEQLMTKDMKYLATAADIADLRVPYAALLKGRGNFLCQRRLQEQMIGPPANRREPLKVMKEWSAKSRTGDKEHTPLLPWFWAEIASDKDDCIRDTCHFKDECFYYTQKDRAMKADFIVVNHTLFMINVALGQTIFPIENRNVVFDEAHSIESAMASAFGFRVSFGRINYVLLNAKKKFLSGDPTKEIIEQTLQEARTFFSNLDQNQPLGSTDHMPHSLKRTLTLLKSIREVLEESDSTEAKQSANAIKELRRDLAMFFLPHLDTHAYVINLPAGNRKNAYHSLEALLVEPADIFREKILKRSEEASTILTSATLAIGGKFDYIARRLGIDVYAHEGGHTVLHYSDEIFDYKNNLKVYLSPDTIEYKGGKNDEEYMRDCVKRAADLIKISKGRALIVCATIKAVKYFNEHLPPLIDYPLKAQGLEASNTELVNWLKSTPNAVLVGSRSFGEGVDIPGEALSLVIVDRIPFPHRYDPVIKKLAEKAENEWMEVTLPLAQKVIQQTIGRLIRSTSDWGVVAVLDSRMGGPNPKKWTKSIKVCFPYKGDVEFTSSLDEIGNFYLQREN